MVRRMISRLPQKWISISLMGIFIWLCIVSLSVEGSRCAGYGHRCWGGSGKRSDTAPLSPLTDSLEDVMSSKRGYGPNLLLQILQNVRGPATAKFLYNWDKFYAARSAAWTSKRDVGEGSEDSQGLMPRAGLEGE